MEYRRTGCVHRCAGIDCGGVKLQMYIALAYWRTGVLACWRAGVSSFQNEVYRESKWRKFNVHRAGSNGQSSSVFTFSAIQPHKTTTIGCQLTGSEFRQAIVRFGSKAHTNAAPK